MLQWQWELSWVRLPVTAVFFTFLYFCLTSKLIYFQREARCSEHVWSNCLYNVVEQSEAHKRNKHQPRLQPKLWQKHFINPLFNLFLISMMWHGLKELSNWLTNILRVQNTLNWSTLDQCRSYHIATYVFTVLKGLSPPYYIWIYLYIRLIIACVIATTFTFLL